MSFPAKTDFPVYVVNEDVVIASGGTASSILNTRGMAIVGVRMPAGWTSASLGLEANVIDATTGMLPVYQGGTIVAETVTTGAHQTMDPTTSISVQFIRLVSGTTVTTVAQAGARTITVVLRYM